jgi:hypothetical protein
MTLSGRDLLTRLLELTPMPAAGTDIAQLVAAVEDILAQRAAVIAMVVPSITLSEIDRPLLIELEHRQNIWQDALAAALRTVGDQRCGTSQLRAYAGSPQDHAGPR